MHAAPRHTHRTSMAARIARLFTGASHSAPQQKMTSQDLAPFLGAQTFMQQPGKPVWSARHFQQFADEAYGRNVIAHRAIAMIATGVASIRWKLFATDSEGARSEVLSHPALQLLQHPNPFQSGSEFMESVVAYRLIAGNAYVQAVAPTDSPPQELYALRPDRVAVIAGKDGVPQGYRYTVGQQHVDFGVDRITGRSNLLHLKTFHPLDDWYGLSPVEAAAYSIDQHNQSGAWNQALLQNGARPSGALVVKMTESGGTLSEDQYYRLKQQVDEQFAGAANAGRPILLEGGLEWKEMSMSPRDMDFIAMKHSAARDIALAFGVPPQLLGIPGDNTYANLAEARIALWEQTILPLAQSVTEALNGWLLPMFDNTIQLSMDTDAISALTAKREALWDRVKGADFLSDEEKRKLVGIG